MEIKLLPLECPNCGEGISSCDRDNLFFCINCGKGYEVEKGGWKEIKVYYARPVLRGKPSYYLPFWVIRTRVSLEKVIRIDSSQLTKEVLTNPDFVSTLRMLFEKRNSTVTMDFFLPSFGTTNRYLLMDNLGMIFTASPPKITPTSPQPMFGGKYRFVDAAKLIESVLFSIEKGNILFDYEFKIEPLKKMIIGIPFMKKESFLIDALKGRKIFYDAVEGIEEIEQLKRRFRWQR